MDSFHSKVKPEDFYSPTFTFEQPDEVRELTLRDPSFHDTEDQTKFLKQKFHLKMQQTAPNNSIVESDPHSANYAIPSTSAETGRGRDQKKTSLFQVSLSDLTKVPWISTGSFHDPKSTERRRVDRKNSQDGLQSEMLLSSRTTHQKKSPGVSPNRSPNRSPERSGVEDKRKAMKSRRENRSVSSMSDFFKTHSGSNYPSVRYGHTSNENSMMMDTMKNEIEDLRTKLKQKEYQLQENINFIENIQGSIRAGENGDFIELKALQILHSKAQATERENIELRDSLRNEVLASERQRSEMNIIKEAFNDHFTQLGPNKRRDNTADMFLEYEHVAKKLEFSETEVLNLHDKITYLQSRIHLLEEENTKLNKTFKEVHNDRQRLKDDIENGIRALKAARDESKRLEEEKSTIMNFVNNDVLHEKNILKVEIERLQDENKRIIDQLTKARYELQDRSNYIDMLERERQVLIESAQEATITMNREELIGQLEKEISFLRNEKEQILNESEALKLQAKEAEEARGELLNKEKQYQAEIQTLKQSLKALESDKEYELYQNDVTEKEQKELYEKRIQEVLKDRSNLQGQVQNLEYDNKKLASQKEEVANKLVRLQARAKELEEQSNNLQNLRKEELQKCQEVVAVREREITSLKSENTRIRNDVEKLKETMTDAMQDLKMELEDKMKEVDNFRQANVNLQDEIHVLQEENKNLAQNLNYQTSIKQLEVINSCQKDVDLDLLKEENLGLKTEIDEYDEKVGQLDKDMRALRQKAQALEQSNQTLNKELDVLSEDNDRLANENKKLTEEFKKLSEKDTFFKSAVQSILNILNSFVQALNKNASTANNFLNNCTPRLKELLTISYLKMATENLGKDAQKGAEYLEEWFIVMLEEIEKNVLKIFKMKEEARLINQDVEDLKNKLEETSHLESRCRELSIECDELKQEKFEIQQKLFTLERTEAKLKKELGSFKERNESITSALDDLKNMNVYLNKSLDEFKKDTLATRTHMENETILAKEVEAHYDNVLKEKKHLEELLSTITSTIPNPDHAKLAKDILDIQFDIIRLEKSSSALEECLIEKESELKAASKKATGKASQELTDLRKEVEHLRNEFQNSHTQISIFIKRKNLLHEELSHVERTEKRRFEYGLEVEKTISKYREDYNELKSKYEDLLQINTNLQARVKELVESNYLLQTEPNVVKPPKMNLGTHSDHLLTMNERVHSQLTTGMDDDFLLRNNKTNSSVLQGSPIPRKSTDNKNRRSALLNSSDLNTGHTENDERGKPNPTNVTKIRLRDKLNEARSVLRNNTREEKENNWD